MGKLGIRNFWLLLRVTSSFHSPFSSSALEPGYNGPKATSSSDNYRDKDEKFHLWAKPLPLRSWLVQTRSRAPLLWSFRPSQVLHMIRQRWLSTLSLCVNGAYNTQHGQYDTMADSGGGTEGEIRERDSRIKNSRTVLCCFHPICGLDVF